MQRSVFVCCCTVGAFGDNRNLGAERGVGDIWEESVGAERRCGGDSRCRKREKDTWGRERVRGTVVSLPTLFTKVILTGFFEQVSFQTSLERFYGFGHS